MGDRTKRTSGHSDTKCINTSQKTITVTKPNDGHSNTFKFRHPTENTIVSIKQCIDNSSVLESSDA